MHVHHIENPRFSRQPQFPFTWQDAAAARHARYIDFRAVRRFAGFQRPRRSLAAALTKSNGVIAESEAGAPRHGSLLHWMMPSSRYRQAGQPGSCGVIGQEGSAASTAVSVVAGLAAGGQAAIDSAEATLVYENGLHSGSGSGRYLGPAAAQDDGSAGLPSRPLVAAAALDLSVLSEHVATGDKTRATAGETAWTKKRLGP